ncbi:MAG: hypothetical protein ACRDKL_00140, partial [Solirubrobacteraceae bacterium]
MSAWRSALGVCALCASIAFAAQAALATSPDPEPPEPAPHGHLVLWIVHREPPPSLLQRVLSAPVRFPTTIQEQTVATFGKDASDVGQTAGSYGEPASDLGKPASDTGQSAGSYGRDPSTFGRDSSNVGHDAANYGQTAGSFGYSLSTINDAVPRAQRAAELAYHHPPHRPAWDTWLQSVRDVFPSLELEVVDVRDDELKADLDAARGTSSYPDILLGDPLPARWSSSEKAPRNVLPTGLIRQYGLFTLGTPVWLSQQELPPGASRAFSPWPQASILRSAPHPVSARAVVAWIDSGWNCGRCRLLSAHPAPDAAAEDALNSFLQGGVLTDPDPDAARFDPSAARLRALGPASIFGPLRMRIEVMRSSANDRLAVVSLRAIVSSPRAFGAVDSLAVLRREPNGPWRVLQLTPNLAHSQIDMGYTALAGFARPGPEAHVAGVGLASPPDGDNRTPQPELWW